MNKFLGEKTALFFMKIMEIEVLSQNPQQNDWFSAFSSLIIQTPGDQAFQVNNFQNFWWELAQLWVFPQSMLELFCPEIEILLGSVAATLGIYVRTS